MLCPSIRSWWKVSNGLTPLSLRDYRRVATLNGNDNALEFETGETTVSYGVRRVSYVHTSAVGWTQIRNCFHWILILIGCWFIFRPLIQHLPGLSDPPTFPYSYSCVLLLPRALEVTGTFPDDTCGVCSLGKDPSKGPTRAAGAARSSQGPIHAFQGYSFGDSGAMERCTRLSEPIPWFKQLVRCPGGRLGLLLHYANQSRCPVTGEQTASLSRQGGYVIAARATAGAVKGRPL